MFHGAKIGGFVKINNSGSGENFCGDAGDTVDGSHYLNEVHSDSSSTSASSSSSSAGGSGHAAMTKSKAKSHHATKDQACGGGWGQDSCKK